MRRIPVGRVLDALAVIAVLFVVYRLFVAPRALGIANAHPAPHVTFSGLDGAPFVLTQHRGRVLFLDFYASWCEPCKISLPLVENFARSHPQVDVVPVDVGEPAAIASPFARHYHLKHVALDPAATSRGFFQIEGYPTMVVVDPQSRVRGTWQGLNPAIALNMANAERQLAQR